MIGTRHVAWLGVAGVAAAALAVGAAGGASSTAPPPPPTAPPAEAASPPPGPADPFSNVRREDYVGPAACGECHEEKLAGWRQTLHAVMNQRADAGVVGDFDDVTVAYGGGTARFTRERGAPMMTLTAAGVTRRYRVTRTIGARALQEYVGVPVDGDHATGDGVELRLPFGWWMARPGWYPQPYFDSWFGPEYGAAPAGAADRARPTFDAFTPEPTPWATRCAWCHNTYPFELRLLRRAGLGHGPEQHVALVHSAQPLATQAAIRDQNLLPVDQLVTVGISCESCHLGGRAHAEDAERTPPRFGPSGPSLRRRPDAPSLAGGRDDPRLVDALCAQCHSTPSPRYPDGAAVRNSTEALDLAAGACAPTVACTDCHDPHQRGPGAEAADAPAHLAACTGCHAALAAPAAARAHAGHDAAVASCLDCHMPRLVEGVGAFVRSHRISSPTDPRMLAAGAPNACNLCHLDRSVRWTVEALGRGWGVRLTPDGAWRAAYGDLDVPVGTAWLTSRHAAVRLAAAHAYARAGDRGALPALIALLDDPVAHDRMWLVLAVERLLGRRLGRAEYDPLAPPAVRARQAHALRARAATWVTARDRR